MSKIKPFYSDDGSNKEWLSGWYLIFILIQPLSLSIGDVKCKQWIYAYDNLSQSLQWTKYKLPADYHGSFRLSFVLPGQLQHKYTTILPDIIDNVYCAFEWFVSANVDEHWMHGKWCMVHGIRRMAFKLLQLWFYSKLCNWMAHSHFIQLSLCFMLFFTFGSFITMRLIRCAANMQNWFRSTAQRNKPMQCICKHNNYHCEYIASIKQKLRLKPKHSDEFLSLVV